MTQSKYLPLINAVFITCLLASNIIAVKLVTLFGIVVTGAILIFPVTYLFGDILTEVYGYAQARRTIWLGFLCNLLLVGAIYVAQVMPAASFWKGQGAWEQILGFAPRLLVASFVAYVCGEFINSFVLAKLKVASNGKWLWSRTISSTVVGQLIDSSIFIALAFGGTGAPVLELILAQWFFKSAWEILATPITYVVVNFLKKADGVDTFDRDTNFNPVAL